MNGQRHRAFSSRTIAGREAEALHHEARHWVLAAPLSFLFRIAWEEQLVDEALGLAFSYTRSGLLRSRLSDLADHVGELFGLLRAELKTIRGLGETEICVDGGNDNSCVYTHQLYANKRYAREDVDDHTLIEDRADNVGKRARFLLALKAPRPLGTTAISLPPSTRLALSAPSASDRALAGESKDLYK